MGHRCSGFERGVEKIGKSPRTRRASNVAAERFRSAGSRATDLTRLSQLSLDRRAQLLAHAGERNPIEHRHEEPPSARQCGD